MYKVNLKLWILSNNILKVLEEKVALLSQKEDQLNRNINFQCFLVKNKKYQNK